MRSLIFTLVVLSFILVGCDLSAKPRPSTPVVDLVGTMVAETLAAVPPTDGPTLTPASTPTSIIMASPTPGTGDVSGKVCYPTGASSMTAYFEAADSHVVKELPISGGESIYTIQLAPGNYLAYAWLNDFSLGGSYSKCGAASNCSDAKPLPFAVSAGLETSGIDLCDWTHGPFDIPYPPGHIASSITGSISGTVSSYPYGNLPVLTIVAFNQDNGYWYWIGTAAAQTDFTFGELPPGSYQVVVYDGKDRAGGSSILTVVAGQNVTANINDWSSTYPDNPVH